MVNIGWYLIRMMSFDVVNNNVYVVFFVFILSVGIIVLIINVSVSSVDIVILVVDMGLVIGIVCVVLFIML